MAIFWSEVLKQSSLLDPTLMLSGLCVCANWLWYQNRAISHARLVPDAQWSAESGQRPVLRRIAELRAVGADSLLHHYLPSHRQDFPNRLLLIFGMLSVAVAAFFILVQRDIKRLLAYSSVENMGLVAVALGIGGPLGIFAALLHILNHSLAKTLLFCGFGNVLLKYGTRDLNVVCGMLKIMPFTAVLFGGGALALAGMPPFNIFLSEFMTITAGLARNHLLIIVLLLLLLTLVLAGLVRMAARVLMAKPPQAVNRGNLGWLTTSPMVILLVMMLAMGTHIPQPVIRILAGASTIVLSGTHDLPAQRSTWHDFLPSGTHIVWRNTVNVNSSSNRGEAILAALKTQFPGAVLDEERQTPEQVTITVKINLLPDVVHYLYYQHDGWLPVLFGNDERTLNGHYAVYYALSMEGAEKCWIVVKALVDADSRGFRQSHRASLPRSGASEIRDMYGLIPLACRISVAWCCPMTGRKICIRCAKMRWIIDCALNRRQIPKRMRLSMRATAMRG